MTAPPSRPREVPWHEGTWTHAPAGPLVCAPTRSGLTVALHAWRITAADDSLH